MQLVRWLSANQNMITNIDNLATFDQIWIRLLVMQTTIIPPNQNLLSKFDYRKHPINETSDCRKILKIIQNFLNKQAAAAKAQGGARFEQLKTYFHQHEHPRKGYPKKEKHSG